MKKNHFFLLIFLLAIAFTSCTKDTITEHYTFYRAEYSTKAEVVANIKSSPAISMVNTGKLFIKGNYAYITELDKGVHVINFSNPANPQNIAFVPVPGNLDIAVRGNTLYADCYTDLVAIDITNPTDIRLQKLIPSVFPRRIYYGYHIDTTNIITNWVKVDTTVTRPYSEPDNNWLYLQDVTFNSPVALSQTGTATVNGTGGSMARFALLGNRMYAVNSSELKIFNTTVTADPKYVGNFVLPSLDVETIFPYKDKLFIGSQIGMMIYSVAQPDNPISLGKFEHARVCDPVVANDHFAYVTLRSGTSCQGIDNELDILNIDNLLQPVLLKRYPMTNPAGLGIDGNTLIICDGTAGLKFFDATDPMNVTLQKTITGIEPLDVIPLNGLAIVVAKDGAYFIDYSNVSNAIVKGKIVINRR